MLSYDVVESSAQYVGCTGCDVFLVICLLSFQVFPVVLEFCQLVFPWLPAIAVLVDQ